MFCVDYEQVGLILIPRATKQTGLRHRKPFQHLLCHRQIPSRQSRQWSITITLTRTLQVFWIKSPTGVSWLRCFGSKKRTIIVILFCEWAITLAGRHVEASIPGSGWGERELLLMAASQPDNWLKSMKQVKIRSKIHDKIAVFRLAWVAWVARSFVHQSGKRISNVSPAWNSRNLCLCAKS